MRVSDVLRSYEDLLPETYFSYAAVLRQNPETFSYQIFPFNLHQVLDTPSSSADNMPLEPKDEVVIYNKDFFEPDRTVSIDGAVTKPGTFKLLENMKIRDNTSTPMFHIPSPSSPEPYAAQKLMIS